ncbi:MAG: oligosaccharide flippase family protein [Chitinivibrionales bacterium]|nr:oligosaccharide flippase family protein [Chitinivibrionales bacterium]
MKFNRLFAYFKSKGARGKMAKGGMYLTIGAGIEDGLRFIRNIILARLLDPAAFGIMAIVMSVDILFDSLTQMGIKESIIHNKKGNERAFLNTAFCINFIRGIILYVAAFFIIPVISDFYNSRQLIPLSRIAFLNIIFLCSMSPYAYSALKKMNYRKWALVFHAGGAISVLLSIVLGIYLRSVWALAIGFASENAVRCIISYMACPYLPSPKIDKESFKEIINYSKGILGLPILAFFFLRTDTFVLAKFVDIAQLGIYNLAKKLVYFPLRAYKTIVSHLLMPRFSSIQGDTQALAREYLKILKGLSIFFVPLITGMAIGAPHILRLVYGPTYVSAATVFRIFCGALLMQVLGATSNVLFFSTGKPQTTRIATIFRLLILLIVIFPMVIKYGITGAAVSSLLAAFTGLVFIMYKVKTNLNIQIRSQLLSYSSGVFVSLIFLILYFSINISVYFFRVI